MIRRARLIAVVVSLAAGALGVTSSTQTWLLVTLSDGGDTLPVPGAAAIPVLAPLSLAVLALGAVLSIAGVALRYVFGALTVCIGVVLGWLTAVVVFTQPASAAASTVTAATGIAGQDAVAALVDGITATAWPAVTLVGWAALTAAGLLTLVTAARWRAAGRRYRTDAVAAASGPADPGSADPGSADPGTAAPDPAEPAIALDAIDSWDGLSRGEDPTG